jgi:hypothetical protein
MLSVNQLQSAAGMYRVIILSARFNMRVYIA